MKHLRSMLIEFSFYSSPISKYPLKDLRDDFISLGSNQTEISSSIDDIHTLTLFLSFMIEKIITNFLLIIYNKKIINFILTVYNEKIIVNFIVLTF